MASILVIIGLLIAATATCLATSQLSESTRRATDRLALAVMGVPLLLSGLALALADTSRFSLTAITLVLVGLLAAALVASKMRLSRTAAATTTNRRTGAGPHALILLVLALFVGTLNWKPYTHLHGGWDPGEYICTAMNIARTGSLAIEDDLVASLDGDTRKALMHERQGNRRTLQAGYLVRNETKGVLAPDYFHLYPAWMAIFSAAGGLEFSYWGHWSIAILAVLMFFLAVSELFSIRAALVASVMLILGPTQVYFGQFTTSEMLARLFIFGAFYWLSRSLKRPSLMPDLLAGLSLGMGFLAHSTTVLPIAGVSLFLLCHAAWLRRWTSFRTLVIAAVCIGLALVRTTLHAPTMIRFLISFILEHPWIVLPAGLGAGAGLGLLVLCRKTLSQHEPGTGWTTVSRWALGILVCAVLVYGYFVRPRYAPGLDALNVRLLGDLICPLTLVLAALFFLRKRWLEWDAGQALFVCASVVTCAVLLPYRLAHPLLMWSLRRYVSLVVPFFVAIAAVPLAELLGARKKSIQSIGIVGLILVLPYLGWRSWPAWQLREHDGLPAFIERVAAPLADADFVLCDHWRYATPLRYAMGLPVYQFSRQPAALDTGEAAALMKTLAARVQAGERVYYLTVGNAFFHPRFRLEPVDELQAESEVLRTTKTRLPRTVLAANERIRIFRCVPHSPESTWSSSLYRVDVGYHAMGLADGFHGAQKAGKAGYRWSNGRGKIFIPLVAGTPVTITARLASARPGVDQESTIPISFSIDGKEIATVGVVAAWREYSFSLPAAEHVSPVGALSIESPTWDPSEHDIRGYPDQLGIRVDWVDVSF